MSSDNNRLKYKDWKYSELGFIAAGVDKMLVLLLVIN